MNAITRVKVQRCRKCRRTAAEVRFPDRTSRRCVFCLAIDRKARATRIADRNGPRVLVAERVDPGDCPEHRAWVASLPCAVPGCRGKSDPHHVRAGTGGGTGLKPSDAWCVPLCGGLAGHHMEGHRIGWRTFEARHGCDLRFLATELAARSPYLNLQPSTENEE